MNIKTLQRFVRDHNGYATALQAHFARLWSRELEESEIKIIRTYTLCGSFMSLESIERGLSLATSVEKANSEFSFMKSEVSKYSANLVQEIKRKLNLSASSPDPALYPDLLSWEESLLQWLQ